MGSKYDQIGFLARCWRDNALKVMMIMHLVLFLVLAALRTGTKNKHFCNARLAPCCLPSFFSCLYPKPRTLTHRPTTYAVTGMTSSLSHSFMPLAALAGVGGAGRQP